MNAKIKVLKEERDIWHFSILYLLYIRVFIYYVFIILYFYNIMILKY
jgi:hypothetical protein